MKKLSFTILIGLIIVLVLEVLAKAGGLSISGTIINEKDELCTNVIVFYNKYNHSLTGPSGRFRLFFRDSSLKEIKLKILSPREDVLALRTVPREKKMLIKIPKCK